MHGWLTPLDRFIDQYGIVVGRVLLGLLFLATGISMVFNFGGITTMIGGSTGLPFASLLAVIVILLKVGGGAALVFGRYIQWGCIALIVFVLLTIVFVHQVSDWGGSLKNLALIGGLLLVYRSAPRSMQSSPTI